MGVYTMLTDKGLGEIFNNTQPGGALIEVSYWVGALDRKLWDDYNNINTVVSAINISAYTTPSDTYPNFSYGISQATSGVNVLNPVNTVYWSSGASPARWQQPVSTNLHPNVSYQGVANTDAIRYIGTWDARLGYYPSNPSTGDFWEISYAGVIEGIFYGVGDRMVFNGSTFLNHTNEDYRGNFRVIVSDNTMPLYINKIGVYAIKRSADGVIINQDPFLLGQVIIPDAQLVQPFKSDLSVDQLVVDFQIDAQAALIDFDNIMFSSQNDYWQQVNANDGQYGLQYDGQVFITNSLSVEDLNATYPTSSDIGVGKLFVSTFETLNKPNPTEEQELPQLVLQYVKSSNYPAGNGTAFAPRIRTTFRTNDEGNCELDLYGSCLNEFGYYSVIPKTDMSFGLGNLKYRWKNITASNEIDGY